MYCQKKHKEIPEKKVPYCLAQRNHRGCLQLRKGEHYGAMPFVQKRNIRRAGYGNLFLRN